MKMYRKKASSKRGGIGSNVCGLKRRDTKDACTLILTRAREAHKMSKEHGKVCVTCPHCSMSMLQVSFYGRHGKQCQMASGYAGDDFISPVFEYPADFEEYTSPPEPAPRSSRPAVKREIEPMQEEVAKNQEATLAEEPMEERVEQETLAEAEAMEEEAMEDVDEEGLVTAEELLNSPEHSAAANLEIDLD